MNPVVDRSDLLAIINNSLDGLAAKHPKDKQIITIIRKTVECVANNGFELITVPKPENPKKKDAAATSKSDRVSSASPERSC